MWIAQNVPPQPSSSSEPGPPVAVSYALTPLGQELLEALKPLVFWSHRRMSSVKAAREAYERQPAE